MSRLTTYWQSRGGGCPMAPLRALFPMMALGGFTLIELLIVVAIIAILAAIAVPNFMEAQVRAKVSRTKTDLRSLAVALESYRTDSNVYPPVGNPSFPSPFDVLTPFTYRLMKITSPVAYITVLPQDPFARQGQPEGNGLPFIDPAYSYAPGNLYFGSAPIFGNNTYRGTVFSVSGRGPDRYILFGNYCMAHPTAQSDGAMARGSYDPTNGTTSEGDVIRLGGGRM